MGSFHLEMGSSLETETWSVRVKDGGVLAAPNTFTFKVDKFLQASGSHDSLFSNVRPRSAHDENPPQLHDITQKRKQTNKQKQVSFAKISFLEIPNWTDRNPNLINHLTYLLSC